MIDYGAIEAHIIADLHRFGPAQAGIDPWQSEYMRQRLTDQCSELECIEVPQTFRHLSEPTKELQMLMAGSLFGHGGHEVLTWMASNVMLIEDGNANVRISKKVSKEKIDGIAAIISGLAVAMSKQGDGPSVYEDRGLTVL